MNIQKEEYKRYADARAKKSPIGKNCLFAFLVGGSICLTGQLLTDLWIYLGIEKDTASALTSCSLVFLAILLTGLGIFDKIAKIAGGGTLVPITGFANAVASSAIESRTEGYIMGVGAKLFTIAGPVIVYGITASFIAGIYCYFFVV